mmetsp:Transcript_117682/g.375024  ORF Transcript_117682/g.375024 Transcript_117682/m.375024 type:complete len:319 (-) Transcript_117682:235-1191(-)
MRYRRPPQPPPPPLLTPATTPAGGAAVPPRADRRPCGVTPLRSPCAGFAPNSRRTSTSLWWRFHVAHQRGDRKSSSGKLTTARASSKAWQVSRCPSSAARHSGVQSSSSRASTSARAARSSRQAAAWPLSAAQCSKVHPFSSASATSALAASNTLSTPAWPPEAAARRATKGGTAAGGLASNPPPLSASRGANSCGRLVVCSGRRRHTSPSPLQVSPGRGVHWAESSQATHSTAPSVASLHKTSSTACPSAPEAQPGRKRGEGECEDDEDDPPPAPPPDNAREAGDNCWPTGMRKLSNEAALSRRCAQRRAADATSTP